MLHHLFPGIGGVCLLLAQVHAIRACHDYVLISTRGTGEPQGPSVGFVGMIDATLSSIPNGIEYDTIYPATANLSGAFDGVADIIRYIDTGLRECPSQKYALLGYSQGSTATNIALKNFTDTSSAAYTAIQAVVNIGNPGHRNGSQANVDENGGSSTRDYIGWYYLAGGGAIPQQYYTDNKVLDICYTGDTVCAVPANTTGGLSPPHGLYGSNAHVQTQGAEFLIQQLDQALSLGLLANRTNTTSSTSAGCSEPPSSSAPVPVNDARSHSPTNFALAFSILLVFSLSRVI